MKLTRKQRKKLNKKKCNLILQIRKEKRQFDGARQNLLRDLRSKNNEEKRAYN